MKLYYLLYGQAQVHRSFLKPKFTELSQARTVVEAAIVNIDLMMSDWILNIMPVLKAAGYSHNQCVVMSEHAFFMKYQVTSFDPATGMAEVVERARTAFTQTSTGQPIVISGKVIVFGVVLPGVVLWLLFAQHEDMLQIRPVRGLWLMGYNEVVWYADFVAHTTPGNFYYQVCEAEGMKMTSHLHNIEDPGGNYDRFVFFGTFMDYLEGWFYWHWWDWDFWDVVYIGDLVHVGPNLYKLKKPFVDKFAPKPGSIRPVDSACLGVKVLRRQILGMDIPPERPPLY